MQSVNCLLKGPGCERGSSPSRPPIRGTNQAGVGAIPTLHFTLFTLHFALCHATGAWAPCAVTQPWLMRVGGALRVVRGLDVDHHPAERRHARAEVLLQLLGQVVCGSDRQGGIERAVKRDLQLAAG